MGDDLKVAKRWFSGRVQQDITVVRWGTFGVPVLVFPLQFLPGLAGPQLHRLRRRQVVLASGEGAWEDIGSSWQLAACLGAKAVPNRVDNWGPAWAHEWSTWRRMLPQYLGELT